MSAPTYPDWDTVENPDREAAEMAVYAAMVDCMDQNIGKLMATLEEEGIAENTMVVFLSDNGACADDWDKTPDVEVGGRDSNVAYGVWHNVSNTPYRMRKGQEHEGGIATPFIVHWPAGIERQNSRIEETAHINDIMPTVLDLAEIEYPKTYRGNELDPLDGQSFLPLLKGECRNVASPYFWEHVGNRAVRHGDWKLVALHQQPWELYNLETDPLEMENLIEENPQQARVLEQHYVAWADKHGVQPWPLDR